MGRDKIADKQTDRKINTMNQHGLRAGSIENMHQGGLLFKEEKSSKGLLSGTKVVFFWSDFYKTWSSRKIGDTVYGHLY